MNILTPFNQLNGVVGEGQPTGIILENVVSSRIAPSEEVFVSARLKCTNAQHTRKPQYLNRINLPNFLF